MSDRRERLKQREAELLREIDALRAEYVRKVKPIGQELFALRESQGLPDFTAPDGRVMRYVGPLPTYLLPEERGGNK